MKLYPGARIRYHTVLQHPLERTNEEQEALVHRLQISAVISLSKQVELEDTFSLSLQSANSCSFGITVTM